MPTLLEWQTAMRQCLLHRDPAAASAMLATHVPPERLDIYRNTFLLTLTNALSLGFPAVKKLVGEAFFEGVASIFIAAHPPGAAWLDLYGGAFPDFLRSFAPAATVPYLGDVARLEWAVHGALRAPEVEPLDLARLGAVPPEDQGRVRFSAVPSLMLVEVGYPADSIWRAVLTEDDDGLRDIPLDSGPLHLLVERRAGGVEVERLGGPAWRFLARLCRGEPLAAVLADSGQSWPFDTAAALAEHLAAGRFCGFEMVARADLQPGDAAIPGSTA